jgi:autotransporter translocation and assembly factor TamB
VKRLWIYISALLLLIVLACAAAAYWLLGTTGGASFALTRLTGLAGLNISVAKVEGRLWDHLRLTGVHVVKGKQTADIRSLDLLWRPRQLFDRNLMVDQLTIAGVRVQDDTPATGKPPNLRWPHVSAMMRSYGVHVSKLKVSDLRYRHLQGTPVVVNDLVSSMAVEFGIVTLRGLHLLTPQGRAAGDMALGFWRPLLTADLLIVPAKPVQKMDTFSIQARLLPGDAPEQFTGPFALAGRTGGAQRLEVSGDLGMTLTAFNIHRLTLFRPGRKGVVTGQGTITPTATEPLFALSLKATDLDLVEEIKRTTRLSGTVNFTGSASRYQGSFALSNRGAGWESASLASNFRGTKEGAQLSQIAGRLLGGAVTGALDVAWAQGTRVRGTLSGRGLDPSKLAAQWKGVVNLDLAGDLEVPRQGAMRGAIRGKLMESVLHGQSLKGELDASFVAKRVNIARLLLIGRGFDLRASGDVEKRLDVAANVSDLSRLVPNAAGQIQAAGWVRYRGNLLSGSLHGRGANLAAAGVRATALQLQATLAEGKGYPMDVTAAASGLTVEKLQVERLLLTLKGTTAQHTLTAQLQSTGSEARAALSGGYQNGIWSGKLVKLFGHDQIGPFALVAPADLTLSKSGVAFSPLVIDGLPGERVELAGNLKRQPSTGTVHASWSAVNLARANTWLKGTTVTGASSGLLDLRLLPGGRLVLNGRVDARGEVIANGRKVSLQWFLAKIDGDDRGIRLTADLLLQGGEGEAHVLFTSPEPARLAVPQTGDLQMNLVNLDLALFKPVTPSNMLMDGRVAGMVSGELSPGARLDLKGNVALTGGHLRYSRDGNLADAVIQTAEVTFNWRGRTSPKLDGKILQLYARTEATGTFTARGKQVGFSRLTLRVDGDQQGTRGNVEASFDKGGALRGSFVSSSPVGTLAPQKGEFAMQWGGIDPALIEPFLPDGIDLHGNFAGEARGTLTAGRTLELSGNAALTGGTVAYRREGEAFDAAIQTAELSFDWRGQEGTKKPAAGLLRLQLRAAATGTYTAKGQQVGISRFTLGIDSDRHGTRATVEAMLDKGGGLRGALTSSSPAGPTIPETGDLVMEWGGIDPSLMKPFLPAGLNLQGNFAGNARGRLLPGKRVDLAGEAVFTQGRAQYLGQSGEVNANLRSATLAFVWRGDSLSAKLDLALAGNGQAHGNFVLPIPARLPIAADPNGAVHGAFVGNVQEHGFLSAFLPGVIQESHGQLDMDLALAGVWSNPRLTGMIRFANAGAYLPMAGITLTNVQFLARMEGNQIRIDNLSANSGAGKLQGAMVVQLSGWKVTGYSGNLSGDSFQTIFLPELQMWTSPRLTFQGQGQNLTVRGEVRVPEMLVSGPPVHHIVTPSGDVILESEPPATAKKKMPLVVDGKVHVVLGDKVQVKASGLDAKLAGEMDLVLKGLDNITSSGEISVVKGSFRAYGMDLAIVRGRLYYRDDPVNQPTLDVLALRTVGDVKAGVTVGGYLRAPVIKLYSEPSMPDADILAYVVLGHPLGTGTGSDQAGMLATAASGLFSFGQSESIQEQIKDRLGLSVLGVEAVSPTSTGLMGYKEVAVTPTGLPNKSVTTTQSLLTVGKYVTPKLYVSYGRSLVTGGSLFMLRYDLFRHWQIETQSGTESGADLYYKLEFE